MRVGHGVAAIAVPVGTVMGGYADRGDRSSGVADSLQAHVVVFTDGTHRFALVVLDVVCVNVDLATAIRRALAELDINEAWVCATHTHAGPETGCWPGGGTTPDRWLDIATTAAKEAAAAAVADERPATLGTTTVDVTDVASVRSRADGARPVPVDVLSCHGADGGLAGTVVVLPVHPTVLPATNTTVSADLTGAVRRAAGERLPGWVVVVAGAGGDISTRGVRRAQDLAECDRLGALVADQVVPVALASEPGITGQVMTATGVVPLSTKQPTARTAATVPDGDTRQAVTLRQGRYIRRSMDLPDELPATVHAACVGTVNLVGLPGEPFLGLRDRAAETVGHVLLLGYVGGYLGYLPTREAFAGPATYETEVSPTAPGGAERLIDVGVGLLLSLRRRCA